MIAIRKCPECLLTPTLYPQPSGKWRWRCQECKQAGELGNTPTAATRNWNRLAKKGTRK